MNRIRTLLTALLGPALGGMMIAGCENQSVRTEKEVRRGPDGKRVVMEKKTIETGGDAGVEEERPRVAIEEERTQVDRHGNVERKTTTIEK
jgi:hypothetical protein